MYPHECSSKIKDFKITEIVWMTRVSNMVPNDSSSVYVKFGGHIPSLSICTFTYLALIHYSVYVLLLLYSLLFLHYLFYILFYLSLLFIHIIIYLQLCYTLFNLNFRMLLNNLFLLHFLVLFYHIFLSHYINSLTLHDTALIVDIMTLNNKRF